MSFNQSDADDDQQLNNNLQLLNSELCSLIDDKEPQGVESTAISKNSAAGVLQEINQKLNDLNLNTDAPEFEFHGYGCMESMSVLPKRLMRFHVNGAKKKSRSSAKNNNFAAANVARQKQKENLEYVEKRCLLKLTGNSFEQNVVLRLTELFKSLHYHISSDLPSNQLNSVPSDYIFDMPRKCSMPHGINVRHHVQVLCTKLERFLSRLRRVLETNRNFDYIKYSECDALLNASFGDLRSLKKYINNELRQRSMQFITQAARDNANTLEHLLIELRENLKSTQIYVHVFNWEMDLEHRYSAAMTARHEATINRALELASSELLAAQAASQLSCEDQFIAEHYQLTNAVHCAKEHEGFLNALLQSPDTYFLPEIVALCDPPKETNNTLSANQVGYGEAENLEDLYFGGVIVELPPSSPPRVHHRSHIPKRNRA